MFVELVWVLERRLLYIMSMSSTHLIQLLATSTNTDPVLWLATTVNTNFTRWLATRATNYLFYRSKPSEDTWFWPVGRTDL